MECNHSRVLSASVGLLHVLSGCESHIFFKGLGEVADIIKSAAKRHLSDGGIRGGQLFSGTLDPVIIQVVDGGAQCDLPEEAAEIFRVHARDGGEIIQGDILGIVILDVAEHLL